MKAILPIPSLLLSLSLLMTALGCRSIDTGGLVEEGVASLYSDRFQGRPTASGEPYRAQERTAAHRTFPFGTMVRVTNLSNGLRTVVRINDRGPHKEGRIIDLSRKSAEEIGLTGLANVRIEVLEGVPDGDQ